MRTSQNTAISPELQQDLVQYGLVRKAAQAGAPMSVNNPNFFGVRNYGSSTELVFSKDPAELDNAGTNISVLAPEIEPFDMLLTRDFSGAVKRADSKTLRQFIKRILDEVK